MKGLNRVVTSAPPSFYSCFSLCFCLVLSHCILWVEVRTPSTSINIHFSYKKRPSTHTFSLTIISQNLHRPCPTKPLMRGTRYFGDGIDGLGLSIILHVFCLISTVLWFTLLRFRLRRRFCVGDDVWSWGVDRWFWWWCR